MNNNLQVAQDLLLNQNDLSLSQLREILLQTMSHGIDFADIYLQLIYFESWGLEDGIVKDCNFTVNKGFGVRAINGEKTGFAYCNDINYDNLYKSAQIARNISTHGQNNSVQTANYQRGNELYLSRNPLLSVTEHEKLAMLQLVDKTVRQQDARIKQVFVSLVGAYEVILVLSSDGDLAADVRPLVRLNVNTVAQSNGRYERGTAGGGKRSDYTYFMQNGLAKEYAKEAARIAILNLDACSAPAGSYPVVLGAGWPGVLLHEAVGHGLEGDFNRKRSSVYSDKIGEKIASDACTIVDNGALAGELRGSINIDDEGTISQNTVLIEKGILKGYMFDKLNARLMGVQSTGNGRRESYAAIPLPRMTNTYMLPGKYDQDEIISSIAKGIYAVNFSGGQVDITSGKFVFSTSEAYLIEHGKITAPVNGITLIGDGPTVLNKISMVANDLRLDTGVGTCGKDGQSIPVGVGQPTLKIDELVVGGTIDHK